MSHYKPDPNKSVNLTIDGMPVTVPEGTRILEAAEKLGIKIPTLCDHPDLCKRSLCRLCVVECDGRGKLMAACANDVSEGVNIVTNNLRIMNIRRTIIGLILANHPQECLTCAKNQKCELQSLTETFGIRESPFRREAALNKAPKIESETLVRDMNKCVKCGRCVEVCQEIQTVRAINSSCRSTQYEICTPYEQALSDGPCIFCGQCAAVCPVGAIYEYDQSGEVWTALNSADRHTVAETAPAVAEGIGREFGLPPGTITAGKMVSALKLIGFDKVLDASVSANETAGEEFRELLDRIKNRSRLPLITSCSPGWFNFARKFYPDLLDHLPSAKGNSGVSAKTRYAKESGIDKSKITFVYITPCIGKKHEAMNIRINGCRDADAALTSREIARMIKLAGIDIANLSGTPFDCIKAGSRDDVPGGVMEAIVRKVRNAYTGESAETPAYNDVQGNERIGETAAEIQGAKIKALAVDGLANARIVMEAIRRGECDAAFVEIICCHADCGADADCGAGGDDES